jgi:preprotein translocase subunit Sec63
VSSTSDLGYLGVGIYTDWTMSLQGTELSDVKKTYRKLSLVYHPDKAPKDQAEEYEAKFVEITKAYKV